MTTYGIGLAKRSRRFTVFTLTDPDRVVVDVRAAFPTVQRQVCFFNLKRYLESREPFYTPRLRPVPRRAPATGTMDRLFAGVLPGEWKRWLRLLLQGGSTETIAREIIPTLHQFSSVDWVKIHDPEGTTLIPEGPSDSTPACLQP